MLRGNGLAVQPQGWAARFPPLALAYYARSCATGRAPECGPMRGFCFLWRRAGDGLHLTLVPVRADSALSGVSLVPLARDCGERVQLFQLDEREQLHAALVELRTADPIAARWSP